MYILKVHSIDRPRPLSSATTTASTSATTATYSAARPGSKPNACCSITELRGVVHLFRSLSPGSTSVSSPASRSTTLFVAAVPNYLSADDFLLFCDSFLDQFTELCFIWNDAVEDRYSVLITVVNQFNADAFYCTYNGKRFRPPEAEVCHVYFTQSVVCCDLEEDAGSPPNGFIELPTCPVCLERLDHDTSGIQVTLCDHSFQCPCVLKWTYLSCKICRLCHQSDEKPSCDVCGTLKNLWICVICGFVGCGRYEEKHAVRHWKDTQHCYSLELEKQQLWDYVGDTYVHRLNQSKIDGKSMVSNSRCTSHNAEFGTCGCSEDPGVSTALYESKVDSIMDEYNRLLATQMETQRQHFESQLVVARSRKESVISEAVEEALTSKMQDIQLKLDQYVEENKAVIETNKDLMKQQEQLRKEAKELEEREALSLKSRDEKISDLKEQIRDVKVFVEAQNTLANMSDTDGVEGGTVLPVQPNTTTSSGSSKRRAKSGRRRN